MKNSVEKLGAFIVQGDESDRFWTLVRPVIENRRKINELIQFTNERTKARDKQINDIHQDLIKLFDMMKKIKKELKIV